MGNNGYKYNIRVAAFIEKEDPDHPGEVRILTVCEDRKYAFPGGKVDNLDALPETNNKFSEFLSVHKNELELILNNLDNFEIDDPKGPDTNELRDILRKELYEELGLSCSTYPAIKVIEPYTIILEKGYSKELIFHRLYMVKIDYPERIRKRINLLSDGDDPEKIKDIRWATILEMISEDKDSSYEESVYQIGLKLYDNYFNKDLDIPKLKFPG